MDRSDHPVRSVGFERRAQPASSRLSHAETVHSSSTASHDSENESVMMMSKEAEIMARNRKDSRFVDTTFPRTDRPISAKPMALSPQIPSYLRSPSPTSARFSRQDRQRSMSCMVLEVGDCPISSSLPERESPKIKCRRDSSEARRHSLVTPKSRQSSRRSSFNPASGTPSLYGRPRALSRASSAYTTTSAEDPYMAHQRALHIFQSPQSATQSPVPRFSSSPCSSTTSRNSHRGLRNQEKSLYESFLQSEESLHGDETEDQALPFTPATIIDWTDPSTRRKEYEKHDRSRRGIRGFWRKVTPKWFQGGGSRVSFYEGDSDVGSVRRYRLDLGEGWQSESHAQR